MNSDSMRSYNAVAKLLHWTIALGILGMIALGWYMGDLPRSDPMRFQLFQLHKSIGITILLLSLFRLTWRLTHKAPPLPSGMAALEVFAAKAVMILFYVLMIGIPLIGWGIVSSSPINLPTLLFGVVPWPHLPILPTLENKKEIAHTLGSIHGFLAYSVLALLALHVGGALKHHFISRDDVLTGMMPNFMTTLLNRLRR
jgi:cytochrome b561